MALLTVKDILDARKIALQKANPVVTGGTSLSFGTPNNNVTALASPPTKKIFSILSWNIKDYKGSKIVAEKKGKEDNPFVNQFIKVVLEELKTDLLVLLETDIDASEAIARIDDEQSSNFGYLATSPPKPTPSLPNPFDNPKTVHDDNFYAEVKKRVEALAGNESMYVPVCSELAFKRVNLPVQFDFSQLQKEISKSHPYGPIREDGQLWWYDLEAILRCYNATFKKQPYTFSQLVSEVQKTKSSGLDGRFVFKLRTKCPTCNGLKRQPSTTVCQLCQGSTHPIDAACPDCYGAKGLSISAPCGICNGAKSALTCPGCGGSRQCKGCGGNGGQVCSHCGGPRRVQCPNCGGRVTGLFGPPCSFCSGQGWGMLTPSCQHCGSCGFITCGTCGGKKTCVGCGGNGSVVMVCQNCGGNGQVVQNVPCGACQATGINPRYICPSCKGVGSNVCTSCPGGSCTNCGGAGKVACVACSSKGVTTSFVCSRCEGDGTESACYDCGATGVYDSEAEAEVLQTLRELLTPTAFSNIDTETYAVLWRKGSLTLPVRVMGGLHLACEDKAVWIDPGNAGLKSKNENGFELGFQDVAKSFNSRPPYIIPLYMDLNKKRQLVPLVSFHAIWGEVPKIKTAEKEKVVKGRSDSVRLLRQIGVQPHEGTAIPIHQAAASILVGDFNLDYNPSSLARDSKGYSQTLQSYVMGVFNDLKKDGYVAASGGTPSGLTPKKYGLQRLTANKKGGKSIYTYAYDTFMVKGPDLTQSVVSCGVFDAIKLIEDLLKANPTLVKWVDKDYGKSGLNNAARAFYIYYEYVSDHMPVMMDILVDEIDPQYKKNLQDHQNHLINLPESKTREHYLGNWTSLVPDHSPKSITYQGNTATVSGLVGIVSSHPYMVGITVDDKVVFLGKTGSPVSASILGKQYKGTFELDSIEGIRTSDFFGAWRDKKLAKSTETNFALVKDNQSETFKMCGIVKWIDSSGAVTVAVKGGQSSLYYFQGPADWSGSGVDVGSKVEGIFDVVK